MFFPERIRSIRITDRMLEIGHGGSPYPRSDILLEKKFGNLEEAEAQKRYTSELQTYKKIVHYDGGIFPFQDKEFDYVICSHVLEHISDIEFFQRNL